MKLSLTLTVAGAMMAMASVVRERLPSMGVLERRDEYQDAMLYHHNIHRRNHSAPDLVWDNTLATYASNHAQRCVFDHDMSEGGGGYGQCLSVWGSFGDVGGLQIWAGTMGVTEGWYNNEMELFQFYGVPEPPAESFSRWGHFSQVVWKSSQRVGCATYLCPRNTVIPGNGWYTVCNYSPGGKNS